MTGLEPVNPLLAKQVLSQLSYTPMVSCEFFFQKTLKIEQRINFFKSFFFSFKSFLYDFTLSYFSYNFRLNTFALSPS